MAGFTVVGVEIEGWYFGMANVGSYAIHPVPTPEAPEFYQVKLSNLDGEEYELIELRCVTVSDAHGELILGLR